MSRVQNLLPTVPASRREATAATTGRDFDDVLSRTFEDRSGNAEAPIPQQEPEHHTKGSRPHLRGHNGSTSRAKGHEQDGPTDADDHGVAIVSAPASIPAASDELTAAAHLFDVSAALDRPSDRPAETDVVAGSVTGVIVDPALLAAMVTTAPTLLTRATAPEPEAGMSSVAAVDGGTAIIVTAPAAAAAGTANPAAIVAAGTNLDGVNPDDVNPNGTTTTRIGPATAVPSATPTSVTTTSKDAAATPLISGASIAAATPANSATAAGPAVAGTPVDAALLAALTAVSGTAPPISATLAGTGLGFVSPAMGIETPAIDGTANAAPTMSGADAVPTSAPTPAPTPAVAVAPASVPGVDPVAAALAGAYGTAASGSTGDRPTAPIPSSAGPDGTIGALTAKGTGPIGAGVVSNDADGTDTGQNPDRDGSAARFGTALDEAVVGASASTAAPTPGSPGVPVAAITGVNGLTGVTGVNSPAQAAATGPAQPSSATSEITDQVAAQVGRQLQGARMREGTHHTVLRLSPEHLGEVTITLDVRAGGVRLDLSAAPLALAALQADLGRLRDDLAGSGLDLGAVTLTAQDAGPGTNGQATARDRWQEQAPTGRDLPGGASAGPAIPDPFARRPAGRTGDGGLDVLA